MSIAWYMIWCIIFRTFGYI